MQYSKSREVTHLEISEISPSLLGELKEFLRQNVIVPVARTGSDGDDGNGRCRFSGFFSEKAVGKIETWLQEKGFREVNRS